MSHHNHEEEIQMSGSTNSDNTNRRNPSHHTHLHLKPTAVLEHIKTKVKGKLTTHHASLEVPTSAVNNNNTKRVNQDHNEIQSKIVLPTTHSQPTSPLHTLSDQQHSDDGNEDKNKEETNASVGNDTASVIISSHIDKDEDNNERVQLRTDHVESDIDVNQKNTKSKAKSNKKGTKSLLESTKPSDTKKRRQIVRRTVQSSSNMHDNKKNKGNDLNNMETVSHLTGFQIRDEDFNTLFNGLPSDEQLIVAYPCSWRKDVFIHGRLFLSINYVCFYTCFFKWEESLCIAYKDIISVTRDKSTKVFSNSIKLRTSNQEQYVFISYTATERAFAALFHLWQNSLLENPLNYQQLRTIVNTDPMSHDESSGDSEGAVSLENNNRRPHSRSLLNTPYHFTESVPVRISSSPTNQEAASSLQDKEPICYLSTCACEAHLARTHTDRVFAFPVDSLFDLIFGDNSFSHAYHESQKLTEYKIGEWHINNETGKRERQVTYKTITQSILGTNTLFCNEKQIIETEKPHSLYVLSSEVFNEGMRYTDAFYVATRFCMFQRDAKHTSLHISAEIRYVKSVNGIAKAFIEKNANSSIEGGVNNLIQRLENKQVAMSNRKSHEEHTSASVPHVRKKKHEKGYRSHRKDKLAMNYVGASDVQVLKQEKTITDDGFFFNIALLIGIFLLLLHIFMCYKLYALDRYLYTIDMSCYDKCKNVCLKSNTHH